MGGSVWACGREFTSALLARIQSAIGADATLSRRTLARRVCDWLEWKTRAGAWAEMSCRVALLTLHRRGCITLPAPLRPAGFTGHGVARVELPPAVPLACRVDELEELELVRVTAATPEWSGLWNKLIATYHYAGYRPLVGAQVRYLIRSAHGWLGAVGWSAAAWHVAARDRWIGWSAAERQGHLHEVVCNSRFLIVPWVRVPNLASRVLALCAQRLPQDWQAAYGYAPVWLESYVEPARFAGTCYRAANWVCVGTTTGRGRQDRAHRAAGTVKAVYLYPLRPAERRRRARGDAAAAAPPPAARAARASAPPRPPESPAPGDWAAEEFGAVALGDARLHQRLLTVARDFYARPQANVPQACGTRARTKAAYRFFAHGDVTMNALLAPHQAATAHRMARERVVLAVQDTTSLNYSTHPATAGLGPIGTRVAGPVGLLVHDTLAYTVDGVALGVLDVQVWARDPAAFGSRHQRYERPLEQKESAKWLRSFAAVAAVQRELPTTTVVSVGDREADLYELFVAAGEPGAPKLLVRAERDRLVADGQGHLWAQVESQPRAGLQALQVPRRPGQPGRVAELEVRFAALTLRPPKRKPNLGPVPMWAVQARETAAPAGVTPVEWMLLTTLEVSSFAQATEKLAWYAQRWQIEVYHRTLKSGCRIEQRQLSSVRRLENCLAIDMVVAWRVVHLIKRGRDTPDVPCTVSFEDHEWKALWSFVHQTPQLPAEPPSLRTAIRLVAGLGGFLGRKGDGEPGCQTLWLGLQQLDAIVMAWQIFTSPSFVRQISVSSPKDYG
jgi:hypothetical protein